MMLFMVSKNRIKGKKGTFCQKKKLYINRKLQIVMLSYIAKMFFGSM